MSDQTPDNADANRTSEYPDPRELFSRYRRQRMSERQVERVMERLANAGLVELEPARLHDSVDEPADIARLHHLYRQYRETRMPAEAQLLNAAMARVNAESTTVQAVASKVSREKGLEKGMVGGRTKSASPSASFLHRVFDAPGLLLCKMLATSDWRQLCGSSIPMVAIPAMVLAIAALVLVPLVVNNPADKSNAGSERIAYNLPVRLMDDSAGVTNGIELDPGMMTGLSSGDNVQTLTFNLGRRLLETSLLTIDTSSSPVTRSIVAGKLANLAVAIENAELTVAVQTLSDLVDDAPVDRTVTTAHIEQVRKLVALRPTAGWLVFGEAAEALAVAERLTRAEGNGASDNTELLVDALGAFTAMRFSDTLPDLGDATVKVLRELGSIRAGDLVEPEQAGRVSQLIQQLFLSVL